MKHRSTLLLIALLTLATVAAAQTESAPLIHIAVREVAAETTNIAVQIGENRKITKILLSSENAGKTTVIDASAAKSFLLPVTLDDGENSFNIVAYENNKIVYTTETPIVIVRTKASTSGATGDARTVPSGVYSSAFASETGSAAFTNGDKLRLNGKGKISNQTAYELEIDASELPPMVGDYAFEIVNKNANKTIVDTETRKIEQDAGLNRQKQRQTVTLKLREGTNTITVAPRVGGTNLKAFARIQVECTACKDEPAPNDSVIVRSIIGLEQVGASSARSEQRPFLSFFFNTPINVGRKKVCPEDKPNCSETEKVKDPNKPRLTFSVWGDIRLTTTPVQSIGSLASFTPAAFASNFVQGDSAGKVNDLVRSFDFLVGFDKQIFGSDKVFSGFLRGRTSLSFIAAGGAISPLSSDKTALFFKIPTERTSQNSAEFFRAFESEIPAGSAYKNIAFVAPERDRFFRQYYAGFRLKTFFENKDVNYHPAIFDVTFGQNEAITNVLKGVILRLDGSTPLPVSKSGFLYLFGSVNMRLGRSRETSPNFFLEPTTGVSLTAADTIVFPVDRLPFQTKDRDVFRIGVGVDVFKLFKKDETP